MKVVLLFMVLCFLCLSISTEAAPTKISLTDKDVRELYAEFKAALVSPPNPDTYKQYEIKDGEEVLVKTKAILNKFNNILFTMSDENVEKYGKLLHMMRDVLAIDAEHIPLAIKHDNSRDVYWYGLHTKWVKEIDSQYNQIFNKGH